MDHKDHINFWYVILALGTLLLLQSYSISAQQIETIPYSKFEELLKTGGVKDIAISETPSLVRAKSRRRIKSPFFGRSH